MMARTLREKLAALEPERRVRIEAETDRLQAAYAKLASMLERSEPDEVARRQASVDQPPPAGKLQR